MVEYVSRAIHFIRARPTSGKNPSRIRAIPNRWAEPTPSLAKVSFAVCRPAHGRLRQEFDNQISRVERGWDSVHGSDYVRDAGRFLGSHGWNPSFNGILDRVYRLWNYTSEITKR
jgi:hypothetical protein